MSKTTYRYREMFNLLMSKILSRYDSGQGIVVKVAPDFDWLLAHHKLYVSVVGIDGVEVADSIANLVADVGPDFFRLTYPEALKRSADVCLLPQQITFYCALHQAKSGYTVMVRK